MTSRLRSLLPGRRSGARSRAAGHFGLDLGERRTKIVGVQRVDGEVVVTHAIDVATPVNLFRDRQLADVVGAAHFVATLAKEYGIEGAQMSVAVPSADVRVIRQILPRSDRQSMLTGLEAEPGLRLGGADAGGVRVDFSDLDPDGMYSAPGLTTLLAVSARTESIAALQRLVESAGFERGVVTAAPIALANGWSAAFPDRVLQNARSVLLHGGYSGVSMVVLDGQIPAASYDASLGVEFLIERTGMATRVAPGAEDALFAPGSPITDDVLQEEWVRRMVGELRRVAGAAAHGAGVLGDADGSGAVWLSGGIARLDGLAQRLGDALGVSVDPFDPYRHFPAGSADGSDGAFGPAAAIAMGLALESLSLAPVRS